MRVLGLILILFIEGVVLARVEVQTYSNVEISLRDRITLLDIADIEQSNQELEAALQSIVLRNIGGDERSTVSLSRQEVLEKYREALEKNQNLKSLNPLMKISETSVIRFSNEIVSREEIKRNLHRHLKSKCLDCTYSIDLSYVPQPKSPFWTIDYDKVSGRGPFLLNLTEGTQTHYISGKINVFKKVSVARHTLSVGQVLQSTDFEEKSIDITLLREVPLMASEMLGRRLNSVVSVGQAILPFHLKREYLVQRGFPVKAVIEDENMQISFQLQAEENGFLGDVIKVKNSETQKISIGKIIEKGIVRVQ